MSLAKRERCPKCDSINLINNMLVEEGQPIKVYVQCCECGAFVARYTLEYYTSNEKYESLLNYCIKSHADSGRRMSRKIRTYSEEIEEEFKRCKELIKKGEDDRRVEEIIEEKDKK